MKQQKLVTRESLQALIDRPDASLQFRAHVIGRALLVLFERQTEGEKRANTTDQDNGIGFTGADGRSGVLGAKSYLKHGTLQEWQIEKWTKKGKSGFSRIVKYHSQLNEAAQIKAEREARETRQ